MCSTFVLYKGLSLHISYRKVILPFYPPCIPTAFDNNRATLIFLPDNSVRKAN